jgi:hypothetical protein
MFGPYAVSSMALIGTRMPDFLTTFLASILHEQGVPDAIRVAEKAAADLRGARLVDADAVKRAAIRADPCRDYRIVARHHHVSPALVYKAWRER